MYIDLAKIFIYDVLWYFIVGSRGCGKTYGAKKTCIDNFINKGEQFIYVRRFKTELKGLNNFFSDISQAYPTHTFAVKGKTFYIDDKICGYALALTTAQQNKSTAYPNVTLIVFDEFILSGGVIRYLTNEVTLFLELYFTISRDRDCKVLFLANSLTIVNPYFVYFNIIRLNSEITLLNEILVYKPNAVDFKKHMKETRIGSLLKGTDYESYAIDNEFLADDYTLVKEKTPDCKQVLNILVDGRTYGVWKNTSTYYISDKHNPTYLLLCVNCLPKDDRKIIYFKESYIYSEMKHCLYNGKLFFEKIQIQEALKKVFI